VNILTEENIKNIEVNLSEYFLKSLK
jgi:hypothetical protein